MFRTFIISSLALLLMTNPAAAKTIFPVVGGSGDAGFQDHCPANEYMTGLAGRAGNVLDQIQIICAPILPNGTQGTKYYGPARGGPGGAVQEFSCASDSFATGDRLRYNDQYNTLTEVDLSCTSIQSNRQTTIVLGGGSLETLLPPEPDPCPNGELATGYAGRYGKNVNALGLYCDARPPAPASTPVPSNQGDPIRLTGKPAATPAPTPRPLNAGDAVLRLTGKGLPTPVPVLACPSGFVWREASPTDHVCVTPIQRTHTAEENAAAPSHVSATDHTYGPNTCVQGYVWRAAYSGDAVCVLPRQRDKAAEENKVAPAMIPAGAH